MAAKNVTMFAGKGGVGKSFIAANLGYALSLQNQRVAIWDADSVFPNQHLIFGVEPPNRLNDVYSGKISLDFCASEVFPNLDLYADRPSLGKVDKYAPAELAKIHAKLSKSGKYDFIIIDSAAGVSKSLVYASHFANINAVIVTDEPTSILDAYGLIKILIRIVGKEKFKLIVNNIIDLDDVNEIWNKIKLATNKFLGFKIDLLGYSIYDRAVKMSIVRQELYIQTNPETETAENIKQIALDLIALNK